MALTFNKIGLIGKYAASTAGLTLRSLADYLRSQGLELLLDEGSAVIWPDHGLEIATRAEIGAECDLTIVVGGDGTFLNAARSLASFDSALLGINLGRLGFLTDISPAHMEVKLQAILSGEYSEDERFLLQCLVERNGQIIHCNEALNDVVIHKWEVARMVELDSYVDGTYVNTLRSDGLIVSTPTGSTAYALSGGGPILLPGLDAMIMVPICPHTMSNRPTVVDANVRIEIVVKGDKENKAQVSCDGQINQPLALGDRITIQQYDHKIRLIHPKDHNHYHVLREKLGWG